jgi:hypothetical protein
VATESAVVHKLSQSNGLAAESEAADTPEDAAILRLSARCGVEIDKP